MEDDMEASGICTDQVRCTHPARRDGRLTSLNARFDFVYTKAALLRFHPKEEVTAVVEASGCPLRAVVEPHSTARCFKQAAPGTMELWALHPPPSSASLGWPGWFTAWAKVAD